MSSPEIYKSMESNNNYESYLFKQLLKSETIRTRLVLGIGVAFLISFIIFMAIYGVDFQGAFRHRRTALILLVYIILLNLLELFILWRLSYARKHITSMPRFAQVFRYFLVFIEINLPTFIILHTSISEESLSSLYSPAFVSYYMFILLSTLRLNFYLCLFTGLVAAIGYFSVGHWLINYTNYLRELDIILLNFFHIEKSILLVIGGLCAGFVASEIRKRIFSSMKHQAERNKIERLFGQQVSMEVVQTLLQDPDRTSPQKLEVTVMFMDIRNFTNFADRHSPEDIVDFQNKFFGLMIEVINRHHGIVNQILGDGFMATFGAPMSKPSHAEDAVKAGVEMLAGLKKLVEKNELPSIQIGIGLNSGPVVAGNIGNHIRQQYSLTGTTVITAARIEQLNKEFKSQFLISQSVYENIGTEQKNFTSLGVVAMKGIRQEIEIYQCKLHK